MVENKLPGKTNRQDVAEFLDKVSSMSRIRPMANRGRLIFAMDATASREHSWRQACQIQGKMFDVSQALGGLDIQLCYYQGFNTFDTSDWCGDSVSLRRHMAAVGCLSGHTQIRKILRHTLDETKKDKVNAVVFVGDCMEEDQSLLYRLAGEIALLNIPIFIFQEGDEPVAATTFRKVAKLTNGAYCYFNAESADRLRVLLEAVAVYAAGGHTALENFSQQKGDIVRQLTQQMKRG